VERYERVGNEIAGEITLYDPVAFLYPLQCQIAIHEPRRPTAGLQHLHRHQRSVEPTFAKYAENTISGRTSDRL